MNFLLYFIKKLAQRHSTVNLFPQFFDIFLQLLILIPHMYCFVYNREHKKCTRSYDIRREFAKYRQNIPYIKTFGVFKNYNIKNGAILAPFFIVFCCYYASLIAPTGQPSSHAPQSMHCSGSTTYLLSPSAIAPTGQVSAHAPHWMQSSPITLGIVFSPYKIIFAFACNNISTPLCV